MPTRSRTSGRKAALRSGLLVAGAAVALWKPSPAAVDAAQEAPAAAAPVAAAPAAPAEQQGLLSQVLGYPLGLRHFVSGEVGKFSFSGIAQGPNQWGIAVGESGEGGPTPVAVVQKLGGGAATYALNYDTDHVSFKPKLAKGIKNVRVMAAGTDGGSGADWSLRVNGEDGTHFSATTDGGELVYEGALTREQPIPIGGQNLSAMYAVDMKRRASSSNLGPGWIRHGLGLRYDSPIGDFKVNMHQNPEAPNGVSVAALYKGDLAGITLKEIPGSPTFQVQAVPTPDGGMQVNAGMNVKGREGVTGGLRVAAKGSQATVAGFTDLAASREVREGLTLESSTRLVVTEAGTDMAPVELKANADLATLAGKYMEEGSKVSTVARYKLGEEKPQLGLAAVVKPKPIGPLNINAAMRSANGAILGKVTAGATVKNVGAAYSATKVSGQDVHHVGQVVFPAEPQVDGDQAKPRVFGRVTKSGMDHGGKPRLQLGMMYDFNAKGAKFAGTSNFFDSGDQLVDDNGVPWPNTMFGQALNAAEVLRRRIKSGAAEGQNWLGKKNFQ